MDECGDTISKIETALLSTMTEQTRTNGHPCVLEEQSDGGVQEETDIQESTRLHYQVNDALPVHLSLVFGLQVSSYTYLLALVKWTDTSIVLNIGFTQYLPSHFVYCFSKNVFFTSVIYNVSFLVFT